MGLSLENFFIHGIDTYDYNNIVPRVLEFEPPALDTITVAPRSSIPKLLPINYPIPYISKLHTHIHPFTYI